MGERRATPTVVAARSSRATPRLGASTALALALAVRAWALGLGLRSGRDVVEHRKDGLSVPAGHRGPQMVHGLPREGKGEAGGAAPSLDTPGRTRPGPARRCGRRQTCGTPSGPHPHPYSPPVQTHPSYVANGGD
jgi:hypothetical protein